ncbi:uncharacterized protein EI90DRAFT_3129760 [Cantharellus anzutake]|uniref:uncharacterized protein n=1 Tax=Cantharellus anzutake TaxID=1750568 RepID=UPI0019085E49|nr:uncharacterized protein EI90DRAFT_3129760 [Cantharellus anzutake]KAF8324580.1 hypothetical protein EI90DRAFT_3129760 [Cantharellus anzutake]
MPKVATMPRRIVTSDDENHASSVLDDRSNGIDTISSDNDASHSTQRTRKRARVSSGGKSIKREGDKREARGRAKENKIGQSLGTPAASGATQEDDNNDDDEEAAAVAAQVPKAVTLPRDIDGYVPGSIVRVKLHNFVTYDDVEFRPGPYLNMILGPNGTGKSSIACAICLGLGFPPSILGRATELSAFVKHGHKEAYVEIELKGRSRERNIVVRRKLFSNKNRSEFTLNGEESTMIKVTKKRSELNVQVGNLCTFLPQDKVSHFAQLTPQQLLRETQKAAGDPRLIEWHDLLIDEGKKLKNTRESYGSISAKLAFEKAQNERIKADVEKFEARQRLQSELEFWELALPYIRYLEAKLAMPALKQAKLVAQAKVNEILGRNAPLKALSDTWKKQAATLKSRKTEYETALKKKTNDLKETASGADRLHTTCERFHKEMGIKERNEKTRRERLTQNAKLIKQLQEKLENPPDVPEDMEVVKRESQPTFDALSQIAIQGSDVKHQLHDLDQERKRAEDLVSRTKQKYESFTIQAVGFSKFYYCSLDRIMDPLQRRWNNLRQWDDGTFRAACWLKENQRHFNAEVFMPPCISVSVTDKRFAAAIESNISASHFKVRGIVQSDDTGGIYTCLKTFICQNEEDYQTFNRIVNDNGLFKDQGGKAARINVWFRPATELPERVFNAEDLKRLGFDVYAFDYIECPDPVKIFLTKECNLYAMPVSLRDGTVNREIVMAKLSESRARGGLFVEGRTKYNVGRSRYGSRLPFMNTSQFKEARNLGDGGVEETTKRRFQADLGNAEKQLRDIGDRITQVQETDERLKERRKEFEERKSSFDKRIKAIQDVRSFVATTNDKLERAERERDALMNVESLEQQKASIRARLMQELTKGSELTENYKEALLQMLSLQERITKISLELLQAIVNDQVLDSIVRKQNARGDKALAFFNKKKAAHDEAKTTLKRLQEDITNKFDNLEESLRARFDAVPKEEKDGWTVEFIQDKINEYESALEANFNIQPGVVDQYKRRLQEIESLERREVASKSDLQKVERNIEKVKSKWLPALQNLVSSIGEKFSAAFDRMGCAGEIRISEADDYEHWTLDILVKFRDKERLQQLTAQRQSGHARAPFSLVDEINQGMDARAERAVHDQLVQVTCANEVGGQYFLITPKLLPDLTYHRRMRVLCVNNGEWLPDEPIGNLRSLVDDYVAHNKN